MTDTYNGSTEAYEGQEEIINDLVAALEAVEARINGVFDHPALLEYGPLSNCNNDCRNIARAALAKAKGDA